MITVNAGPGQGYVHVYTTGAKVTGLYLKVGTYVSVTGTGSTATSIVASTVAVFRDAASSRIVPHVLTADYLGGSNGTHAISWAAAAPLLTWAETNQADAPAIHAAGIKTMLYVDPNREQSGSQMDTPNPAAYAYDCNGNRVYDTYASNVKQYVTDPSSSAMQSVFATYSASVASAAPFDALFEDDGGPLSEFVPYTPFSAMPCGYSDAAWISGEIALNQASALPVIVNGLSGLNGHLPSLGIGVLAGANALGGTLEQCYASTGQPEMNGWLWLAIENSELQVAAMHKLFECMAGDSQPGASSIASRTFAFASFLLSYDPSTSVYRTEYGTPSGLHVFPETGLVALNPAVAAPASIAGLQQPGGTYAREFAACYLAGTFVGGCAVVVNSDTAAHAFPFAKYRHSLTLAGAGTLDGGAASAAGPPPASSLAAQTAAIVFP